MEYKDSCDVHDEHHGEREQQVSEGDGRQESFSNGRTLC